jgi:hypothetical protein
MSRFSGKRPSAGVIIGVLALVMAIAGTAAAVPSNNTPITKATIRTIADNEINKLAPTLSVAGARSARTANTANSAKIATNVLSAMVQADGTMLGSIPGGATSTLHASLPQYVQYEVTFGRDITGCTISASIADNTADPPVGMIGVGVLDATTLTVDTASQPGKGAELPFYVQAICPAR